MELTKEIIMEAIAPVEDPEMHLSLVDLGLIYDVQINEDGLVEIAMTLTSPMCPIGPELSGMVKAAVFKLDGVKNVEVEIVFDPPWDPAEMASDAAKDELGIW
jgi:metal-sulfur cluster biosynthetic enzyme